MIEISISYNNDRDELFDRLDNICLSIKEKKRAEKKLKNILKTVSIATIFTAISKVAALAINENFENPEALNNLTSDSSFLDNIAAIATVCRAIAKFFINILWIIRNPMQALYILFSWLSGVGMWALILFLAFNIFIGLSARSEEIKDKVRHRKSVAIILYIATLIITLLLKLYLNITN